MRMNTTDESLREDFYIFPDTQFVVDNRAFTVEPVDISNYRQRVG